MSPEGFENTFRDSLHGHSMALAAESIRRNEDNNNTHFLREILNVRGIVICVAKKRVSYFI